MQALSTKNACKLFTSSSMLSSWPFLSRSFTFLDRSEEWITQGWVSNAEHPHLTECHPLTATLTHCFCTLPPGARIVCSEFIWARPTCTCTCILLDILMYMLFIFRARRSIDATSHGEWKTQKWTGKKYKTFWVNMCSYFLGISKVLVVSISSYVQINLRW